MEPVPPMPSGDYTGSRSNYTSCPPHNPYLAQPPTLSFRSFHENHFSNSHRQAFFAGAPAQWSSAPPGDLNWPRGEQEAAPANDDTVSTHSYHNTFSDTAVYDQQAAVEVRENSSRPDPLSLVPQLSKEAIEIFEFSRRFRQEKAEAAQLEQNRIKKRWIKRRKLTKLGFAIDEGDSGTDDSEDAANEGYEPKDGDGGNERGDGDQDEGEDDDWDNNQELVELPATDVSFLTQNIRRTERIRQQLYGLNSSSDENAPSLRGIKTIEILESLVNQAYEDSLGSQASTQQEAGASQETDNTKRRYRLNQSVERRNQVVYWPGMPLRC
ncbi:hypothetical protein EDD21DRAFT_370504 [Dissophora ornata]|nr:hypothetical protein BGZ58_008621 [Dissophora ornata]KAI8602942.1 hypothetical protein EDD21DRAFT_370504 [Dissophora ornata]